MDRITCHMYENALPKEGDLVVVKILDVGDNGAQCQLLEYGGIKGLLPCTEYSRKRIRSIKKIVKPGNRDVLTVLRVDTDKKYIDLSKKHVTRDEHQQTESRFQKSNYVHSCLSHLSEIHQRNLEDMYQIIGWPMYRDFGHAFDGLEQAAKNFSILDKYHIEGNIMSDLQKSLECYFSL